LYLKINYCYSGNLNYNFETVMKKVLIVDDERSFLKSLSEGFEPYKKEFQVVTASDGREAMRILESEPIDLLVTDLRMPEIDGFKLIAYASRNFPDLPIIVITAFGTTEIENQLKNFITAYIEKPIDFQNFVDQIRSTLAGVASGSFRGITLFSFLQLIELEKKSCTVVVESGSKIGALYFSSGKFVGAEMGDLKDEAAAYEILSWEDPKIELGKPPKKSVQRVSIRITDLLLEVAKLRDESQRLGEESTSDDISLEDITNQMHLTVEQENSAKKLEQKTVSISETAFSMPENSGSHDVGSLVEFIEESLQKLISSDGTLGVGFFDLRDAKILAYDGSEDTEIKNFAQVVAEFSATEIKILERLQPNDTLEEIIINLNKRHALVRTLERNRRICVLLILDKESSLPLARLNLQKSIENFS
jgi:CheY-like chemotaxis protein